MEVLYQEFCHALEQRTTGQGSWQFQQGKSFGDLFEVHIRYIKKVR